MSSIISKIFSISLVSLLLLTACGSASGNTPTAAPVQVVAADSTQSTNLSVTQTMLTPLAATAAVEPRSTPMIKPAPTQAPEEATIGAISVESPFRRKDTPPEGIAE